jgi:hypothetical protein
LAHGMEIVQLVKVVGRGQYRLGGPGRLPTAATSNTAPRSNRARLIEIWTPPRGSPPSLASGRCRRVVSFFILGKHRFGHQEAAVLEPNIVWPASPSASHVQFLCRGKMARIDRQESFILKNSPGFIPYSAMDSRFIGSTSLPVAGLRRLGPHCECGNIRRSIGRRARDARHHQDHEHGSLFGGGSFLATVFWTEFDGTVNIRLVPLLVVFLFLAGLAGVGRISRQLPGGIVHVRSGRSRRTGHALPHPAPFTVISMLRAPARRTILSGTIFSISLIKCGILLAHRTNCPGGTSGGQSRWVLAAVAVGVGSSRAGFGFQLSVRLDLG